MFYPIVYTPYRWAVGLLDQTHKVVLQRPDKPRSDLFLALKSSHELVPVKDAIYYSRDAVHGTTTAVDLDLNKSDMFASAFGAAYMFFVLPPPLPPLRTTSPLLPLRTTSPLLPLLRTTSPLLPLPPLPPLRTMSPQLLPPVLPPILLPPVNIKCPWEAIHQKLCSRNMAPVLNARAQQCSQRSCLGGSPFVFTACGQEHTTCLDCLIAYLRTCITTLTECKTQPWFVNDIMSLDNDGFIICCPGTTGCDCLTVMSLRAYHNIFEEHQSADGLQTIAQLQVLMNALKQRLNH
jgi:hypothetical protein